MRRFARAAFGAVTGLTTALVAWQYGVRRRPGRDATAEHMAALQPDARFDVFPEEA